MSLTTGHAPLSAEPADANYRLEGAAHRLFFETFPRRVRALLGETVVLDTRRGKLLHETGQLPQLYVPREDLAQGLLEPSRTVTRCPFKGEASYWSIRAAERVVGDAAWAYVEPLASAGWLHGHVALYWDRMDAWLDEEERVFGHLRDPYHRVDARKSSRQVRILVRGRSVVESEHAFVLSETGLPNRFYLPPEDVPPELLADSSKHTFCPYKGRASYRTLKLEGELFEDAAWLYPEPLPDALAVKDHLAFATGGEIQVEVDGEEVP